MPFSKKNSQLANRVGHTRIHAWGESHLWAKGRKEPSLSGFDEPRIPVPLGQGVSSNNARKATDRSPLLRH